MFSQLPVSVDIALAWKGIQVMLENPPREVGLY